MTKQNTKKNKDDMIKRIASELNKMVKQHENYNIPHSYSLYTDNNGYKKVKKS